MKVFATFMIVWHMSLDMASKIVGHVSSGLLLIASPGFLNIIPFDFEYGFEAQALMIVYGVILLFAGYLAKGAKYFEWTVSLSSMAGLLLFLLGPMTFYPLGYPTWRVLTYVTVLSLGITSLSLVYLTREDVPTSKRQSL